jgi:hypothetical protein
MIVVEPIVARTGCGLEEKKFGRRGGWSLGGQEGDGVHRCFVHGRH